MDALRFGVGDEVECQVGVAEWARGKVVALMYRDEQMPPGVVAPYQVRLDPQPGQQTAEADQDGPDAGGGGQDRAEAEAEAEGEAEAARLANSVPALRRISLASKIAWRCREM